MIVWVNHPPFGGYDAGVGGVTDLDQLNSPESCPAQGQDCSAVVVIARASGFAQPMPRHVDQPVRNPPFVVEPDHEVDQVAAV